MNVQIQMPPPLTMPVHPDPRHYQRLDDYVADMTRWWNYVAQEEVHVVGPLVHSFAAHWRNRWYACHFPGVAAAPPSGQ